MLKKIDTESKAYKNVREGVSWFSGLGGGFTLECISIPFMSMMVKNRLIRLSCFSGIVTMSTLVSVIGHNMSGEIVDSLAYCWNKGVDKLTELHDDEIDDDEPDDGYAVETKQTFAGINIPDKNATPIAEKEFIGDVVDKVQPFVFATEDDAKQFVEEVARYVNKFGHVDIAYAFAAAGKKLPIEVYDIALKFGWSKDDAKAWGVDKIYEDTYVADLFNYHDISDTYQILDFKEE